MSCMFESTPSYSFPWIPLWLKIGILTFSPHLARSF